MKHSKLLLTLAIPLSVASFTQCQTLEEKITDLEARVTLLEEKKSKARFKNWLGRHKNIQEEFSALQDKYGVLSTTLEQLGQVAPVGQQRGTQAQFDKLRSEIQQLISAEPLDIDAAKSKINLLRKLNPARRPSADDYDELLEGRIRYDIREA